MEPTVSHTPASATAPTVGQPLVEFVRTNRMVAGWLIAALSVVFLAAGVFLFMKAFRSTPSAEPDKPLTGGKDSLPELVKPPGEIENLHRGDYNVGWLALLLGFLVTATGATWLLAAPPSSDVAKERTDARILLLVIGMGLGVVLILAGLAYFYRWSESLTKWLDTSETHELRWVLIPLMMMVAGAGLVFAAIQPGRAEERDNPSVRRIVYGSNFALTALLLIVALVVVNVVIAVKVPNRLDATATGFYSLSDETKRLLAGLKEPISAYAILPDASDRDIADIRQLLLATQDAARGNFKLRFLNEIADRTFVNELRSTYPQLDLTLSQRSVFGAVLLTTGVDQKRSAVIPDSEFTTTQNQKMVFQGESRLFRELFTLADTETKPIVYFTQSNEEMTIDPAAEAPDDRKLSRLRAYLEKNYLEVRPLELALENPTVPADAAVVVIAEPQVPFSPVAAAAIRKYMNDPAKKGRLLVLAGIVPGPNNQGVMKTGLEDVLAEMNVRLGERFVYNFPIEQNPQPLRILAQFSDASIRSQNEVAMAIAKVSRTIPLFLPREVGPIQGNPAFQVLPLLGSIGFTWLEQDRIPGGRMRETLEAVASNDEVKQAKDLTRGQRPLAVLVSRASAAAAPGAPNTPGTPVSAVFGNAHFVSDDIGKQSPPGSAPITFDLVGVTIDWLRGRPSIAAAEIEAKTYAEYQFPQPSTVDRARLEYLPLGLAFLTIVGIGAGVWVVRRR